MSQDKIKIASQNGWILIFVCWLIAMAALFGSLFFSEIMGLKPCVLCWWQRIFHLSISGVISGGIISSGE